MKSSVVLTCCGLLRLQPQMHNGKGIGGSMKTLIEAWLLEAPAGLSQELAGTVKLVSVDQPLETKDSFCCQIELDGRLRGSFWVAVETEALARLLMAARVTSDES